MSNAMPDYNESPSCNFLAHKFTSIDRNVPSKEKDLSLASKPRSMPDEFLAALTNARVQIRPTAIFNRPETRVFYAAKDVLKTLGLHNWHVHGQVGYGRIFKSSAADDYVKTLGFDPHQAFNSKSADVVITDNKGRPALVIEYQGSGHDGQNDAIKKFVCQKAGVRLLEVYPLPVTDDQPLPDEIDREAVKQAIICQIDEYLCDDTHD